MLISSKPKPTKTTATGIEEAIANDVGRDSGSMVGSGVGVNSGEGEGLGEVCAVSTVKKTVEVLSEEKTPPNRT